MRALILRLGACMLLVALPPVLVFAACVSGPGLPVGQALLVSAAAALISAFFGGLAVMRGLALPAIGLSAAVKNFVAADFKLESPLAKTGWPAAAALVSAMNRLMLELSAYRGFHLNQVLEERAKAQALIETITDGVVLTDDKGNILYSNQRALSLLGIPKLTPETKIPGSVQRKEFLPLLEKMLASPESLYKAEAMLLGEDGDFSVAKTCLLLSRHFRLATLKSPGRVIVLRDITVEKEIESARESFFHMLTHDMRAPLASIQGYAQMLEMKTVKDPLSESGKFLKAILHSSSRLTGMIEDILTTMKLERGEMTVNPKPMNAAALCAGIFEVYDPLAARKDIAFSVQAAENIEFQADPRLLERVLANLVGNALKFTPSHGKITISYRTDGAAVLFQVEDNGPGIPAAMQTEIFEKYAQLEEHKFMGFGLGLAMCKLVAEAHKGRVWVESEEGKGSRFFVRLPLTPQKH